MEVEFKYKVNADYEEALINNGFTFAGAKHQVDEYFLGGEIIKEYPLYLRIRSDLKNNTYAFEFHEWRFNFATKETEIPLGSKEDADKIKYIMESLGYHIQCVVDKARKTYKKDDITVVLDDVAGLGRFVEVEVEGESTPKTLEKLNEISKKLGLDKETLIPDQGYVELCMNAQN